MATVNTERALTEYQRRVGILMNEVVMRDVAIAELEEQLADARLEVKQLQQRTADADLESEHISRGSAASLL
jgi:hypothetical protein